MATSTTAHTQASTNEWLEATEAALSETVELFHYQSAASGSKLVGGQRVRSSPTRINNGGNTLTAASPSRGSIDPPAHMATSRPPVGEPTDEDVTMLKKLVEASTEKLREQHQQEKKESANDAAPELKKKPSWRERGAILRRKSSAKMKKIKLEEHQRQQMTPAPKKQEKQLEKKQNNRTVFASESTRVADQKKNKKKKSWGFVRMFRRSKNKKAESSNGDQQAQEQEQASITPASSQVPTPEKTTQSDFNGGVKMISVSSASSHVSAHLNDRDMGATTASSSQPSTELGRSRSQQSNDDRPESFVESLAKRLEEMQAESPARNSAAGSSSGGGYFGDEKNACINMSRQPSEAPNSTAATQPIDNRQRTILNNIPPAVKTISSPSAVSSLAQEQPSDSPSDPLLLHNSANNVDSMYLLSTVEESDGNGNLEQVLSMPSDWHSSQSSPPEEISVGVDHQPDQSLSLSLSASYEETLEPSFERSATEEIEEESRNKTTTRDALSSTLSAAKKQLAKNEKKEQHRRSQAEEDDKQEVKVDDRGEESNAEEAELQQPKTSTSTSSSNSPGDITQEIMEWSQEVAANMSWWSSKPTPVLGDSEEAETELEPGAATDEPVADAGDETTTREEESPTEPILSELTADTGDFHPSTPNIRKNNNSLESNVTRLASGKETSENTQKQDEKLVTKALQCVATPEVSHSSDCDAIEPAIELPLPPRPQRKRSQRLSRFTRNRSSSSAAKALDSSKTSSEHDDEPEQISARDNGARTTSKPSTPKSRRVQRLRSRVLEVVRSLEESADGIEIEADVVDTSDDSESGQILTPSESSVKNIDATAETVEKVEGNAEEVITSDNDVSRMSRKKRIDEVQRKRRQAALTSEKGWEGYGLHDEPDLASNIISWDSDSFNKASKVSDRKRPSRRPNTVKKAPAELPESPSSPWFTFNALTTTRSLDANPNPGEALPPLKVTPPEKESSGSAAAPKARRRSKRKSRGRRKTRVLDDDFFSDTDSDNRPEQDLPLLIKKLTNQNVQKTMSMISREFKMTMSSQEEDRMEESSSEIGNIDSEFSTDDDDDGEATCEEAESGAEYDTEGYSSATSHTDSAFGEGTVGSSIREVDDDDSFLAGGEEKKETDAGDMVDAPKLNKGVTNNQESGWLRTLSMDYACGPSNEEIMAMNAESQA